MPDTNDPSRDLWLALAQPDSLDRVVETHRRIEELAGAGALLSEEAGRLLAQAFSAMRDLAADDPVRSRDLILQLLLPLCLATQTGQDGEYAASRFRDILGEWLEALSSSGFSPVRDEVADALRQALGTDDFEAACWSLGKVGFRTDEVAAALWAVAGRESGEDGDVALSTLVALGEGFHDRDRLIAALHTRARLRHSLPLIWAIRSLGDPTSLDIVEESWLLDLASPSWSHKSFLLVHVVSDIADANQGRPEIQDRAWAILYGLHGADPDNIGPALALGGDLATLCDSPRVVPDLLGMIDAKAGDSDREDHGRYLLYRRVRDCVRPRQIEGWSAQIAESTIAVLLGDATRDTKASGVYRTLAMDLKRHAWDILLSLGHSHMLSAEVFEAAIATETGPYVQRSIIEWLACFRYREIPPTAARWVTEHRRIARDDAAADLTVRTASTRLLQSAASREAFELLLRTGFSLDGSALLSSLDALSEVAHALATKEDPSIAEGLVAILASCAERNQRVAAAAALIELAASGRIPEHLIATIWRAALDPERDDPELSRIVRVLGHLPRSLVPDDFEEHLIGWASGDGQVAQRAVEALARQGFLPERPELMPGLVGLTTVDGRWGLVPGSRASDVNGFAIGLLFDVQPDLFEDALAQYIREKDWEVAAQVIHHLDLRHDRGGRLPDAFVTALVARIGIHQTEYTTETEPFDALGRWEPGALAGEPWESAWAGWMPDARVALADALGRMAEPGPHDRERAVAKLLLLTQDGIYAVRRSAYRSIARLSAKSLQAFCLSGFDSPSRELRRRGAEAGGWIVEEMDFIEVSERYLADPEKAVREAAQRSISERRSRRYSAANLERVLAAQGGTDGVMLAAWASGRALARTGDDDLPHLIRAYAATQVFDGHVAYWLDRIIKGMAERWKEVTQKWPEPWYSWDGALLRGKGRLVSPGGQEVPVEYCIVKEPPKDPAGTHGWHGVAWTTGGMLPMSSGDEGLELILSDGKRGRLQVTSGSFQRHLFVGSGPYPS